MMGHGLSLQDDGHSCQFSEVIGQLLSPVPYHYASLLAIYLPSIKTLKKPTQDEEGNAVSPLFFLVRVEAVQRARSSPHNCLKSHSTWKHVTGLLDRTQCSFLGDMPASVPPSWGVKSSHCKGLKNSDSGLGGAGCWENTGSVWKWSQVQGHPSTSTHQLDVLNDCFMQ